MDTVSDFILKRLSEWGISRVFGYPDDGINGLIGAFGRGSVSRLNSCRSDMKKPQRSWPVPTRSLPGKLGCA